jgi:Ser/Thr protein kinase RdoA (MazF antagonist)
MSKTRPKEVGITREQPDLSIIAAQFAGTGEVVDVREFGNGNINHTFLVSVQHASAQRFILQRINTRVFRHPELVMRNMRVFSGHVLGRLAASAPGPLGEWQIPRVLTTKSGQDHWRDSENGFWRAISFIESAVSHETIQNTDHAREVGYAVGTFHHLLSDLPVESLADTLEGFHVTPGYLQAYERIQAVTMVPETVDVRFCREFVACRKTWAHVLEDARNRGELPLRTIHGDPKVNNVMIDTQTGKARSLVDLDTVKPGLIHYDIGDCLRSGCNPLGEETDRLPDVRFDVDLCRAMLLGYLTAAGRFMTPRDYEYLYDAVRLISFELGLRFFTDHLAGDVYFRARFPGHNLSRALVQFALTSSIEAQESAIRSIVEECR